MSRHLSCCSAFVTPTPPPLLLSTTITSGISKTEERIVQGKTLPAIRPELDDDDDDEVK